MTNASMPEPARYHAGTPVHPAAIAMPRIAALARSLLDGAPADLSLLPYLSPSTGQSVVDALRLIWERNT